MPFDPRVQMLSNYAPREFQVECLRCKRSAVVDKYAMRRRFGDVTLQECALKISASKGCALAGTYGTAQCSVRVSETPVWTWARLQEARIGGWSAYLTCHRRFAALKSTDSCPEVIRLDVLSLVAALGDDFPLEKLPTKCKCPQCGTGSIEIEWRVPEPPKTPAPIQAQPPLQLRPRGADLARQKLGVAKG